MAQQTNLYDHQIIADNSGGRMIRWQPVNMENLESYFPILLC